jgi:lipopolysaccharide transport system permease protein
MFALPVAYPLDVVPERWRLLYSANPMVGVVSGFRSALLGEPFYWRCIGMSLAVTSVLLVAGAYYFRRVEKSLADII